MRRIEVEKRRRLRKKVIDVRGNTMGKGYRRKSGYIFVKVDIYMYKVALVLIWVEIVVPLSIKICIFFCW